MKERRLVIGIELEHPIQRLDGALDAPLVQECARQQEERLEVPWLGQQDVHHERDRDGWRLGPSQQIAQRQRGLHVGWQQLERVLVGQPCARPVLAALLEPAEIQPDLRDHGVELQRRVAGVDRAVDVAELRGHAGLELEQIGPAGFEDARLTQRLERGTGMARDQPDPRRHDKRLDVLRRELQQFLRALDRFEPAVHGEQGAHLPEQRAGLRRVQGQCLTEAIQRFPVQAATRIDLAEERRRPRRLGATGQRALHLDGGMLQEAFGDVIGRQRQGVLRRNRRGSALGGIKLLEDAVQQTLIEMELAAHLVRRHVGGDLRDDGDLRVFVLEIDGQRVLLRDVERLQFERPFRRPERPVEVPEVAERETEVVVRRGVGGIGLHGPAEGMLRVFEALQFDQHQADPVPGDRVLRVICQHLPVRFQGELQPPPMEEGEGQVQARRHQLGEQAQRPLEGLERTVPVGQLGTEHAEIVPAERILRIDRDGLFVGHRGFLPPPRLMQADPALVPELGGGRILGEEQVVQLKCGRDVPTQQVHLRHRLPDETGIFAGVERQPVLPEGLDVVALLPEGEPEIVVRQGRALRHRGARHRGPRRRGARSLAPGAVPAERQVVLGPGKRGVERRGARRGAARFFVVAQIPIDECQQIVGVGVVWVLLDRRLQRLPRLLREAAIVERLAVVEEGDGGVRIEGLGAFEGGRRRFEIAATPLGEPELEQGRDVIRLAGENHPEFGGRLVPLRECRAGPAEFPAGGDIGGLATEPFPQFREAAIVVAGGVIRDLEVLRRDLHARIELERPDELLDGLGDEALLVIQDAKVVVRSRIGRIDAAGERAQDREIAFRWRRPGHASLTSAGWRRRWPGGSRGQEAAESGHAA